MNKFLYPSILFAALSLQHASAGKASVFSEQSGILVVEVENATAVSDWHKSTDFADFRGSGHFEWTGILTYHFTINTPGNYEFRWRSRIGEGNNKTESNDSWVRFPSGRNISGEHSLDDWTKAYMNKLGEWTWTTKTVDHVGKLLRQNFTAGDHTIQISGRSRGHVIDRFVLYKYDTVSFDDQQFDNAPESASTGKTVATPAVPQTPAESPDTDLPANPPVASPVASPDIPAQQWSVAANSTEAGQCVANTISLQPLNDIYVEGNDIKDNGNLRIDDSERMSLLKFDLSNIPANVNSAVLTWSIGKDDGQGTIVVSAASHSDWNESNSARLPDISHQIGSFNSSWNHDSRYGFPLDHTLLGTGAATLVMQMAQGANGIAIVPTVNDDEPRLELSGAGSFCANYKANIENGSTTNLAEPDTGEASAGGGALGPFMLVILTIFLTVFAPRHKARLSI